MLPWIIIGIVIFVNQLSLFYKPHPQPHISWVTSNKYMIFGGLLKVGAWDLFATTNQQKGLPTRNTKEYVFIFYFCCLSFFISIVRVYQRQCMQLLISCLKNSSFRHKYAWTICHCTFRKQQSINHYILQIKSGVFFPCENWKSVKVNQADLILLPFLPFLFHTVKVSTKRKRPSKISAIVCFFLFNFRYWFPDFYCIIILTQPLNILLIEPSIILMLLLNIMKNLPNIKKPAPQKIIHNVL